MALRQTHFNRGSTIKDAYYKIAYISGNKNLITVNVFIFRSAQDSIDNPTTPVDSFDFIIDGKYLDHDGGASDKNYTKQAYEYLKNNVIVDVSYGSKYDLLNAVDC